ncbi:hypothetical protein [Companilactobacillus metriopterae]|uniref:hypothetical protein n=1 Tax=Companilactobacillus metriopterae TaxID=1909267 RepID=UPI00100AF384|nr:hypothetical protein [Companilactobacillus metriopterae]
MFKRKGSNKSLKTKKRMIGILAVAVILIGVVGGFGVKQALALDNQTGSAVTRSAPVVASASGSDARSSTSHLVVTSDNTGTDAGGGSSNTSTPSVNLNNMSSYPQTGSVHEYGLVVLGFAMIFGLMTFYTKKVWRQSAN